MTINQQTLRELCVRVASGDEKARRDFERHVPPLVEIVVHRWLRQQGKSSTCAVDDSASAGRARQLTKELCTRMIAEFEPENWSAAKSSDDTLLVCGTADTLTWA